MMYNRIHVSTSSAALLFELSRGQCKEAPAQITAEVRAVNAEVSPYANMHGFDTRILTTVKTPGESLESIEVQTMYCKTAGGKELQ
jgi:hypothetical protein